VGGRDLLADDPAEGPALLTVGGADGCAEVGQVLDEADVEDVLGLVVEPAAAELVVHVAVEPGVVEEHAGVVEAEHVERHREVELDPPDRAAAGVAGAENECAGALAAYLAG
jgi:hypothetical protein